MTYNQFVQAVEQKVKEEVKGNIRVSVYTARKYNGTCRRGLLFSEKGSNVSPTIYLEEYYRQYHQGGTIEAVAREIVTLYGKIRFKEPWKEEVVKDYDTLKRWIVYRLINKEANREILQGMPYVPYLDLAIVFYVLLETSVYGTATMPVKEEHLKMWGVTKEMVYEQACRNTERLLPGELRTMRSVLAELTDVEDTEEDDVLYVLSNQFRSFGASAILYPGQLEKAGAYLGEDFYVLPSSVHETILVPESVAVGKDLLSAMVTEINETQVDKEEVLSNRAYFYDRAHRKLNM